MSVTTWDDEDESCEFSVNPDTCCESTEEVEFCDNCGLYLCKIHHAEHYDACLDEWIERQDMMYPDRNGDSPNDDMPLEFLEESTVDVDALYDSMMRGQ